MRPSAASSPSSASTPAAPPAPGLDAASLRRAQEHLLLHFRSVTVLCAPDGAGGIAPSFDVLARWLEEYQQAFVAANAAIHANRPHAFLHRRLTLVAGDRLVATPSLERLGEVARGCGMLPVALLPLRALLDEPDATTRLRAAVPTLQLQLDCRVLSEPLPDEDRRRCVAALVALAEANGELTLVGDIATLRAEGLLEREAFNRTGLTMMRSPDGLRPQHRLHASMPCRDFFAWHVDGAGDLFPCAGLSGHAPARLGSIARPFDALLPALGESWPALDAVGLRGPRLELPPQAGPFDLCALHREAVTRLSAI